MDKYALSSKEKAVKYCGETSQQNNVDRLSKLPVELITQIISLLPMEDAVRADILSKKWRYQWTKTTNLEFYDYSLYFRKMPLKEHFIIFMQRSLMLLGKQRIKSFSLECINQYDAVLLHTWITALIRREVQKFKVYCSVEDSLVLPIHLFANKSLTEIHLIVPCKLRVPTSFCFSNIKILYLCQVTFLKTGFSKSNVLNINFPVLKELSLWGCCWENFQRINIHAPVLSHFSIGDIEFYYYHRLSTVVNCGKKIKSETFIKDRDGIPPCERIALVSPLSITNATIEYSATYLLSDHERLMLPCEFLKQLSCLKSLTLSCDAIIALSYPWTIKENMSHLKSILHLTISGGIPQDCGSLHNLLQHLSCLESLTVCKGNEVSEDALLLGSYGDCPLPLLKVIEFSAFSGRKGEMELARFLLKNAQALEKLTILSKGFRKTRRLTAASEELQRFHRASAHAKIEFH